MLRVLNVAYPLLPVSPDSAGGAEQILCLLERSLAVREVHSIVIAAKGSQVAGQLRETIIAPGDIDDRLRAEAQAEHRRTIHKVLCDERVDVIHYHGLDFPAYLPENCPPDIRQVATVHLPPHWYDGAAFRSTEIHHVFVSESQARSAPAGTAPRSIIANGIDLARYTETRKPREELLFIGRICPEKGAELALQVAHQTNLPLTLAGPVHPFAYHQQYFREQIEPQLDEERRHIGSVGLSQKASLLARAKALLIPSLAPETSSLVAMEACAAGVPTIALRNGALPEVIEHGVTGFVVDSVEEMAEAVSAIGQIDCERCRSIAGQRFSVERMASQYLSLYERLVA